MYEIEQRTQLVARDNVTFALELAVLHNSAPFDFTDHVVRMQWRRSNALALDTSSDGPEITIAGNVVSIVVPVDVLEAVAVGRYDFDVIATGPDFAWQLAVGQVDLRKGVTHD